MQFRFSFMEKYEIQKLRDLPIERVAEEMGMKVEHHKALCPFHDDHHASLSFNTREQLQMLCLHEEFHRHHRPGDEIPGEGFPRGLPMARRGTSGSAGERRFFLIFPWGLFIALPHQGLQESSGGSSWGLDAFSRGNPSFDASRYARFFEHPWLNGAARRFLFEERKIDWRVVNWCRLTSWTDKKGINWLQIPYFDTGGTAYRNSEQKPGLPEDAHGFHRCFACGRQGGWACKKRPDFTDYTDSASHW